ncbi:hypothetical protein MMC12_004861 [Toensbergia leucococca]|nr:hypothetical protein [Toensbergia leucococca]
MPSPPGDGNSEVLPQPSADADKEEKTKESSSLFGKKFRMNFPKKLGRSSVDTKPAVVDEKAEESDKSEEKEDKIVEHNFLGTIQKIRYDYEDLLREYPSRPLVTGISPSMPSETPMIRLPPYTAVIIQEDTPDSGGVADLYRGTVGSLGRDADLVEKSAPMWLGDLLLRNQIPFKETAKVSFVLQPFQDLLPSIASIDGNARLNANRMLRAKKILAYVAERIESQPELPDPDALRAEEYLELYCHNQLIPPTMTLATMRAHIWKTGGDVLLYYKSNGRKPSVERHMMREPSAEQLMDIAMPATSG